MCRENWKKNQTYSVRSRQKCLYNLVNYVFYACQKTYRQECINIVAWIGKDNLPALCSSSLNFSLPILYFLPLGSMKFVFLHNKRLSCYFSTLLISLLSPEKFQIFNGVLLIKTYISLCEICMVRGHTKTTSLISKMDLGRKLAVGWQQCYSFHRRWRRVLHSADRWKDFSRINVIT